MLAIIRNLIALGKNPPQPCQCVCKCSHNPLDLGNGFSAETRDEFQYRVLEFKLPVTGQPPIVSFTYGGKEVFRIDETGGKNT